MGNKCLTSSQADVFTAHKNSIDTESSHHRDRFIVKSGSMDSMKEIDDDKIRVQRSSIILIIGDNRIKVATACYIKSLEGNNGHPVEVIVGTRDVDAAKNSLLLRAGVRLIKADMNSPETLLRAIRDSGADTVFLVSPNQANRTVQTTTGITACRRAGVGHVVVLSSTCVDRDGPSIFGDQCKHLETFIKNSGLSYTIVRIPILMDNYLSQLQSMAEYGIFYRPLPPNSKRNAITVADLGMAAGSILMTPGDFSDKTICLNGPLTDCETASEAFSAALGKTVIYEQATYESYKQTLLEALMPEWQVLGILELFRMYERQESFCRGSTQELENILGRSPQTVYDLAMAAVARTQPKKRERGASETKDGCPSGAELDLIEPLTLQEEIGEGLMPYSVLNILRAVDVSPSSSLCPAGITGILKVTLSVGIPYGKDNIRIKDESKDMNPENTCQQNDVHMRNLDLRFCILLDGIFTFLPPTAVSGNYITRAIGSMESRSTSLSGYVIKQTSPLCLSLKGSRGESSTFLIESRSELDCQRWLHALNAHVEHVDCTAGSRWLF